MDSVEKHMKSVSINEKPQAEKAKVGLLPLAAKKPQNTKGEKVMVATNIRPIEIAKNQPIFKYDVKILYFFRQADRTEPVAIELSKSTRPGVEHENDKERCVKVYKEVVAQHKEFSSGGPFFYDRQACLYSLSEIKGSPSYSVERNISKRDNFVRAELTLTKAADSFQSTSNDIVNTVSQRPANADRTLLEALNVIVSAPAFENPNVVTVGPCVHYLIDTAGISGIPFKAFREGGLYSGVGASKAVKTLEGVGKNGTGIFMSTEMKTTLFHPDWLNLIEVFRTFPGFRPDLTATSHAARTMAKSIIGSYVSLQYGSHKGAEATVMRVRGIGASAREERFEVDGKPTTVERYFKAKYNVELNYPKLFTIETKGKNGKVLLPAEVLLLCPSQVVTNEQMVNSEQAEMIRMSALQPQDRKRFTEQIAAATHLASDSMNGAIKVQKPLTVEGIILPKPMILFNGNRAADLNNPKSKYPTDFNRAGSFFIPKSLTNWEMCFVEGEEVPGLDQQLVNEMKSNGMQASMPSTVKISRREDLDRVFRNAKAAKRQLIFFVIKTLYHFHKEIKALEQKYDVLTQEIHLETAQKVGRQAQTRQNIINKTNMKLGGLNYFIKSGAFGNPNRLIIGFETSQRGGAGGDSEKPIAVGFAANMLDHFQKFAGGYVFVKRERDVYGSLIKDTITTILRTAKKNRGPPNDILVYFNGVTEGQFGLINEEYSKSIKEACVALSASYRPNITIIASSKMHNERLYKSVNNRVSNLEPGTVVDHTIVHPHYNEWYHSSAVARQGTVKTTKFTLIFTTNVAEPMSNIEELTNDLCYDHQIVFHPVGLPVPLFIAGRYSQRGAMVLEVNGAVYNTSGKLDLEATNRQLGYANKQLFETRFNA
ncbi:unnamed protein product [Caenorhabditis sp. 36 PRJEB53466]|nr:unnamed protein product [Caenorhabditis sp. 36 PRJEB53466]